MKGLKTINAWAITGMHGLYVGWHFTKKEMIQAHIGAFGCDWKDCQKKGDKAIKIQITYFEEE